MDAQRAHTVYAGNDGNARLLRHGPRRGLATHDADRFRRGTNELDAPLAAQRRKIPVLAQKTVAGMDRFRAGHFRHTQNRLLVQIRVRRRNARQQIPFVRQPRPRRARVRFGKNGHRTHAQFLASAENTHTDLTPIRNKNFLKHAHTR